MKGVNFKKVCAIICAIALVITSITYAPTKVVSAQSYDSLTYTTLSSDIAFNYINNGIAANNPELLDAGVTMQMAYSADNKAADTVITINGVATAAGSGAVTYVGNGITKLNPTLFENNAYTLVVVTTTTGTLEMVVKRGTPTAGGEIPSQGGETPSQGGEQPSQGGEQPPQGGEVVTTTVAPTTQTPATATPLKVQGVVAQTEVGESTIDNSVMVAWASSTDPNNVAGYDATVTSYNVYIYKNGQVLTHIVNATNGGVIGGLSAGNYQAAVAAVNSKGEGALSDFINFTVTGATLNYTYPVECNGPKTPNGLTIITANPEVQPSVGNETNAIEVAWAASSEVTVPSYDTTVTGYNIYLFDAATGNPYRRVYVDGITTNYTAIKSVSAGTYLVYLSAVNANGQESALAAPGISLPSSVTVTGETYDNAQDFGYPDQPTLPVGLEIITEGIQYGFTVAWSAEADLTGIRLNLFVDGVCVKTGINGAESSYYENRVAAGTYNVEIRAQYISNNVESFPISKTVTIAADPGIATQAPSALADPNYSGYEGEDTTTKAPTVDEPSSGNNDTTTKAPTVDEPSSGNNDTTTKAPTVDEPSSGNNDVTTKAPTVVNPTTKAPVTVAPTTAGKVTVPARAKVKSATKKKAAKKAKVSIKKVKGAKGYKVQFSVTKKFKNVLVTKTVKKSTVTITSNKLKNKKKLYVRVKAYKLDGKKKVWAKKWSKVKKVKIK